MKKKLGHLLLNKKLKISTAESCTGGLLSSKLTDISGSSNFIHLNFVTYSNEAKQKILNVKAETIKHFGVVSEECSIEMAKGLLNFTNSDIAVSTTGIAGPTGGTKEKPVGLMYSTICSKNNYKTYKIQVNSSLTRVEIKEQFVNEVIKNIIEFINEFY